ncbi:MAG TPA: hypothetical protein VF175_12800 [Lacipirellula sp.]
MDLSIPSITPEMRAALQASGGLPIQVQDPETLQVYTVVEQPVEITLDEEYIRRCIDEGLADIDAGRVAPWDIEATIAEAKRRHAENR